VDLAKIDRYRSRRGSQKGFPVNLARIDRLARHGATYAGPILKFPLPEFPFRCRKLRGVVAREQMPVDVGRDLNR
jgi:hypothetical protein